MGSDRTNVRGELVLFWRRLSYATPARSATKIHAKRIPTGPRRADGRRSAASLHAHELDLLERRPPGLAGTALLADPDAEWENLAARTERSVLLRLPSLHATSRRDTNSVARHRRSLRSVPGHADHRRF